MSIDKLRNAIDRAWITWGPEEQYRNEADRDETRAEVVTNVEGLLQKAVDPKTLAVILEEAEFCLAKRPNSGEWRESMTKIKNVIINKERNEGAFFITEADLHQALTDAIRESRSKDNARKVATLIISEIKEKRS